MGAIEETWSILSTVELQWRNLPAILRDDPWSIDHRRSAGITPSMHVRDVLAWIAENPPHMLPDLVAFSAPEASGPRYLQRRGDGVSIATFGDDEPPPERLQHGEIEEGPHQIGREIVRTKRATTWPIDRYVARGEITGAQAAAARKLYGDFRSARLDAKCVASYAEPAGGGAGGWDELSVRQADARSRYVAAMESVGLTLSPVLVHVVCQGEPASSWAMQRRARGRARAAAAGLEALTLALDALALHYRRQRAEDAA